MSQLISTTSRFDKILNILGGILHHSLSELKALTVMNKSILRRYVLIATVAVLPACSSVSTSIQIGDQVSSQWPSYGRDYTNQRFSPATQINRDNVQNLALAWQYNSGIKKTFQATPIVSDGVMYLSLISSSDKAARFSVGIVPIILYYRKLLGSGFLCLQR